MLRKFSWRAAQDVLAIVCSAALLVVVLIFANGCDNSGPTQPDTDFTYYVQGFVKLKNDAQALSSIRVSVIDNVTQQANSGITGSDGKTQEWRWNTAPGTLWVTSEGTQGGLGLQPFDDKNIIPTCGRHPESNTDQLQLCRFTIEMQTAVQ